MTNITLFDWKCETLCRKMGDDECNVVEWEMMNIMLKDGR